MKKLMANFSFILTALTTLTLAIGCKAMDVPQLAKNVQLPLPKESYQFEDPSEYMIDVDASQIQLLLNSKSSFLLYIGNDYCSSCLEFKPAFLSYIIESNLLVYAFDNIVYHNQYADLRENNPNTFPEYPATPSLYFFKDGELRTRQNGHARMFELSTLRPIMKSYADIINVNAIHDPNYVLTPEQMNDGVYFIYDRSNRDLRDFYNNKLFPHLVKLKRTLFQFEISINPLLQEAITTTYNFTESTPSLFTIQNGSIISIASITTIDSDQLLEYYVTSYTSLN